MITTTTTTRSTVQCKTQLLPVTGPALTTVWSTSAFPSVIRQHISSGTFACERAEWVGTATVTTRRSRSKTFVDIWHYTDTQSVSESVQAPQIPQWGPPNTLWALPLWATSLPWTPSLLCGPFTLIEGTSLPYGSFHLHGDLIGRGSKVVRAGPGQSSRHQMYVQDYRDCIDWWTKMQCRHCVMTV